MRQKPRNSACVRFVAVGRGWLRERRACACEPLQARLLAEADVSAFQPELLWLLRIVAVNERDGNRDE